METIHGGASKFREVIGDRAFAIVCQATSSYLVLVEVPAAALYMVRCIKS